MFSSPNRSGSSAGALLQIGLVALQVLFLFGEENMQSYQTYLEKSTCRATMPIWRRKP
jgi:hypothetical protein